MKIHNINKKIIISLIIEKDSFILIIYNEL